MRLIQNRLEYVPLKKRKPPTTVSGIMHKVIVYESGAMVGYGFVIHYPDGKMSQPELFDIAGNKLPQGMYILSMTDEQHNVVVPRNIQ